MRRLLFALAAIAIAWTGISHAVDSALEAGEHARQAAESRYDLGE